MKTSLRLSKTLTICLICACFTHARAEDKAGKKETDEAVERARREMRLVDDIYKTAVVLVTTHYVNDEDDLPAGSAAKALFAAIEKKGWHKVRLVDTSGEPINDENLPQEGFESRAVKKLLAGADVYDEIFSKDGKRYLNAATPIPVVLDKCIMCHENYRSVAKGKPIGALSYQIPILD